MFGLGSIYDVLIIAAFLGLQFFLSTRQSKFWGLILPVVFLVWRGTIIFTTDVNVLAEVLITAVGLLFLLGQFSAGRKQVKERQKKELEKMTSHDLN
ncbi:hypothetical protein [Nosocomiicoccus sp. HMSC09A07]|uniref:hypothetical protein n=1 Tax=Nosocomiicoccus sp. HMSC09A07 TaxID=1581145 RepID=UPI0008A11794|nr:hypothetical protein [Nosocomiicoccus sp. HMSC09A07]OFS64390.1 hypothetical protein HMPREF3177_00545 [Nosocomiicoccus sp. HMSC09A07]